MPSVPLITPGSTPGVVSLRLLIVDDEPGEFALIEDGFSRCGVELDLVTATTAVMALAELGMSGPSGRPQLALIDINMPMVSGFDLAAQLIAEGIPTILMSSQVDASRASRARSLGALDLLAKPSDAHGYSAFAARILRMRPGG